MSNRRRLRFALMAPIAVLIGAMGALGAPARAQAAIGPSVFRMGEFGQGAGQLEFNGGGIAADPASGHVFVSELQNNRISEFTAWGEFVKSFGWGVKDGSEELQSCGPAEPTLNPERSLCRAGIGGEAPGEMLRPNGIALAPNGDLYLFERNNRRVQAFSEAGAFLFMFGGEVDKTTGADVCTAADIAGGDECGAGVEGTGPSQFSVEYLVRTTNSYLAVGPDGHIYVGDRNRIQVFEEDGTYIESLPLPEEGNPGALALDPGSGDLYFSYRWGTEAANAYRLDGETGAVIYPLPTTAPEAIAVGPGGDLYVSDDPVPSSNLLPEENPHLVELNRPGVVVDECCHSTVKIHESITLPVLATDVVTEGGEADLYVAHSNVGAQEVGFIDVRGPAPERFLPPPEVPPRIEAQQAVAVGEAEASLEATINPNFWEDTSYHLQYGTAPCSSGGCEADTAQTSLGAGIEKKPIRTEAVSLSGLQPGTIYHYRFVAESGGGGPVYGPERTFTTFAPEAHQSPCANEAFRYGPGARLPDCRAYEMVSPVDKAGGDILVQGNINSTPARLDQAAPTGEAVTYSSYRSFADNESAPYTSQYLASRGENGWSTRGISPAQQDGAFNGSKLDSSYKGFSEDLSSGWLVQEAEPPLAAGAVPGYANLYRRELGTGSYEALSTAAPAEAIPADYNVELQGASADGKRTIFRADGKLTEDAASGSVYQVYESFKGGLRLVSKKNSGAAATAGASAGSVTSGLNNGREANSATAISEDGSKIYWSETGGSEQKLYLRVNAFKTVEVSTGAATFWAANPEGSEAIYAEGGELKLFSLASESSSTLVSEGVQGVMGESRDLSRIYLVSEAALAGEAQAGKPNLYLYEEGQPLAFVATLSEGDMEATEPSPVELSPRIHLGYVSMSGSTAVFMSRAALTGAENVDSESGEEDAEVFRYDAETRRLDCVSCNATGVAPRGHALVVNGREKNYQYASRIPAWEFQLHAPRVVADGGDRVFFDSLNRLVPADTNNAEDVYEWEAPGTGTCTASAPGYDVKASGCVTLVSSGEDPRGAEFVDASANGRDAFFLTGKSLVSWDPGQIDLYDAREGGGFPAPPSARAPECEGEEACQGPPSTPPAPLAPNASETFHGTGNLHPGPDCSFYDRRARALAHRNRALRHRARALLRRAHRLSHRNPRAAHRLARRAHRLAKVSRRRAKLAKRLARKTKQCRKAHRRSR